MDRDGLASVFPGPQLRGRVTFERIEGGAFPPRRDPCFAEGATRQLGGIWRKPGAPFILPTLQIRGPTISGSAGHLPRQFLERHDFGLGRNRATRG
jgi:hypothetical protein